MKGIDIFVLVVLAIAVVGVLIAMRKSKKSGCGLGSCSGCTQQCSFRQINPAPKVSSPMKLNIKKNLKKAKN